MHAGVVANRPFRETRCQKEPRAERKDHDAEPDADNRVIFAGVSRQRSEERDHADPEAHRNGAADAERPISVAAGSRPYPPRSAGLLCRRIEQSANLRLVCRSTLLDALT